MVRMAEENRDWGYRRIQGALSNLGHEIARSTIAEMLQRHGMEPAPERRRKTTWKEFLTQHWELIVAADFFTVEVWTRRGLQRFLVLFFIELSTRKVEIAGIATAANGLWMSQIGRNLTDTVDGILPGKRYLIRDSGDVDLSCLQVNEEQHIIGHQAAPFLRCAEREMRGTWFGKRRRQFRIQCRDQPGRVWRFE